MTIFNQVNLVLPLMFLFVFSSSASGQIEVKFSSASVTASDSMNTASFEIFVTHELSTNPELIGFQVEFSIFGAAPGESKISATGIPGPSDRDYVFAPTSTGPLGDITDQGKQVIIGDFLFSGSVPLQSGKALTRIDLELELDLTPGDLVDHTIRIDTDPSKTFFIGQNDIRIPFTTSDGTIQVEPLMLGDVNLDRKVDFSDIAPFIVLLASGDFQTEADVDQSGEVDFSDIAPFIIILAAQ